ncbi:MAG: DMT family transporter [Patescibacteria group bacterium]
MNLALILAFGAMLCWGIGDFLIQRTVKKIGVLETLAWITGSSAVIMIPIIIYRGIALSPNDILLLTLLGALTFVSGMLDFKALSIGKLSVMETIMAIELPLTIMLGVIAFNESLSGGQWLLVLMIFIGIILVSVNFKNLHHRDFLEKGSILAIISGIVFALVNFFSASLAKTIDPMIAIWFPWLACGTLCIIYISRFKKRHFRQFVKNSYNHWKLIALVSLVDLAAWLFYAFAVEKEELSITIAITESYIVIALILGVIINKEKIRPLQYLGAALAIIGSIVIGIIS